MENSTAPAVVGAIDPAMISAETMLGDLMSAIVDEIKAIDMPWHLKGQADQAETIERVERRSKAIIVRLAEIIASGNRPTITATLESVTVKAGIKATLAMSRESAERHELIDAQGSEVLVVVMNSEDYSGGTKPKAKPDQRRLPGLGEDDE